MEKSKVLIVGGMGYLGRRLVKASLAEGHKTYVLHRPEIGVDIDKAQLLLSFKDQGANLVHGSFNDHHSLLNAVICAISGVHIRSHQILLQLKLVDAIKEAGNVKRFLPSEFGTDPATMKNAMEPGRVTFDDKMVVRKAIQDAGIPYIYVSANCFAAYLLGGLCQPGKIFPSRDHVVLLGDGNPKGQDYADQVGLTHYYHVCYEGCLTNFEIGAEGEEASKLYPQIKYTKVDEYLKRYL
ncbi:hypothetical protein ACSBR1_041151 [Camellia fascicularis]